MIFSFICALFLFLKPNFLKNETEKLLLKYVVYNLIFIYLFNFKNKKIKTENRSSAFGFQKN